MTTARLVRKHRERLGLTQLQLAAKAGLHVKTVEGIERALSSPSVPTAKKLAPILGVDWTDLL